VDFFWYGLIYSDPNYFFAHAIFFCPFFCAICDVVLPGGGGDDMRGVWGVVGACLRGVDGRLCVENLGG